VLLAIVRSADELSIVCEESKVPMDVKTERGWRVLKVLGPLDFSLVGILSDLANALAKAGVSIFAISTYDTDYVLVKQDQLDVALFALREAGHEVLEREI
jgi:hypothetical protein